jgi:hypothetical protein
VRIEAFGESYFALAAGNDEIAQILALGDRVLFVLDGKAIEVVPAESR